MSTSPLTRRTLLKGVGLAALAGAVAPTLAACSGIRTRGRRRRTCLLPHLGHRLRLPPLHRHPGLGEERVERCRRPVDPRRRRVRGQAADGARVRRTAGRHPDQRRLRQGLLRRGLAARSARVHGEGRHQRRRLLRGGVQLPEAAGRGSRGLADHDQPGRHLHQHRRLQGGRCRPAADGLVRQRLDLGRLPRRRSEAEQAGRAVRLPGVPRHRAGDRLDGQQRQRRDLLQGRHAIHPGRAARHRCDPVGGRPRSEAQGASRTSPRSPPARTRRTGRCRSWPPARSP